LIMKKLFMNLLDTHKGFVIDNERIVYAFVTRVLFVKCLRNNAVFAFEVTVYEFVTTECCL
jgi:hypothetical protein